MIFQLNGLSYNVEMYGDGFPFLLLHGFTGDSSTWASFCAEWGEHSTLVMPDIIGHGKTDSPNNPDRYDIQLVAKDLKDLLDQLSLNQVDLLGYSMGGRLALTFTILYPDRVRNLILESSSPGLQSEEEQELRRMKDHELANFILEKGIGLFVDYWENIPLFSTMKRMTDSVRKEIRTQRLSNNPVGLAGSLKGMGTGAQPSWWEHLKHLQHKVLLITGELDQKFCMIASKMRKSLKNSSLVMVKNSGHANHVEEKEKFVTIVSDFLKIT
ncbi:MAG: 2-succinyl-6-hydroxy-2,4-cyclohexadiene-1-carboxylate synthase [Bacillota bacterium]|nr:2-succinyl-6-hydroxy-2,4-cyclohexadiene-1-carboxylate synthase [Bacillota bacterium]